MLGRFNGRCAGDRKDGVVQRMRRGRRRRLLVAAISLTVFFSVVGAALAYAFEEGYGGSWVCAETCYIQSAGAHTFVSNSGWTISGGAPYLACQLFNHEGDNVVKHETTSCIVTRSNNGHYVWGRVYNESGGSGSEELDGYAHTN